MSSIVCQNSKVATHPRRVHRENETRPRRPRHVAGRQYAAYIRGYASCSDRCAAVHPPQCAAPQHTAAGRCRPGTRLRTRRRRRARETTLSTLSSHPALFYLADWQISLSWIQEQRKRRVFYFVVLHVFYKLSFVGSKIERHDWVLTCSVSMKIK